MPKISAKVTEVLADLILMVPPDEQAVLMADILGKTGRLFSREERRTSRSESSRAVQVTERYRATNLPGNLNRRL